jgi:hypothetical protein
MINKYVLAVLFIGSSVSAWAQTPKIVGKFANVTGLVTVSNGDSLSSAVNGGGFAVGNRVVSTASGGATLKFDNGCELTLKANESVTVDENNKCALVAALPPSVVAGAAGGVSGAGALGPTLIVAGMAAVMITSSRASKKTSGS